MTNEAATRRGMAWWLATDYVLVLVFAVVGRASHAEVLDVPGIVMTAWPFLAACAVGHVIAAAWRRPLALWPTGVVVWATTVVGGMLLRFTSEAGTAPAFVVVATVTLALLLLGWRGIARLVRPGGPRA